MANKNLNDIVNDFSRETLKKEAKKYASAGKEAAREIRENIVNLWFDEYNSTSVNEATQYVPYTKILNDYAAQIIINSYVDLDVYKDKPKAEAWRSKYGGDWDAKYYVLVYLQMTKGIIGLPEESKAYPEHGWTNDYFVQRSYGLRDTIFNSVLWDQWDQTVQKYLK